MEYYLQLSLCRRSTAASIKCTWPTDTYDNRYQFILFHGDLLIKVCINTLREKKTTTHASKSVHGKSRRRNRRCPLRPGDNAKDCLKVRIPILSPNVAFSADVGIRARYWDRCYRAGGRKGGCCCDGRGGSNYSRRSSCR